MDKEKNQKNLKKENKSLSKIKPPVGFCTLTGNAAFCKSLASKSSIILSSGDGYNSSDAELIYDVSGATGFDSEAFAAIIDLLMQLRAAGDDQNVFIQNNTVIRDQILHQLKNEILKAENKLTTSQIKNLEVVASNSFDKKALTDILRSLLESSKKKSDKINRASAGADSVYEQDLIAKIGMVAPVIKLQTKLVELNVMDKVKSFVTDVIKDSVPRVITSQSELINKIIDKSEIEEIRENILFNKSKYERDQRDYRRNLNRVYSEMRASLNRKTISSNINEILKSSSFHSVNFQKEIKKNLIKVSSSSDVLNKFKSIYERSIRRESFNRTVNKSELINKESSEMLTTEERSAVKDIVNLKIGGIQINKNFVETISKHNIALTNKNVRRRHYRRTLENLQNINNTTYSDENIYSKSLTSQLVNIQNVDSEIFENFINEYRESQKNSISGRDVRNYSRIISDKVQKHIQSDILTNLNVRMRHYKDAVSNLQKINNTTYSDENIYSKFLTSQLVNIKNIDSKAFENFINEYHENYIDSAFRRNMLTYSDVITDKIKKHIQNETIFTVKNKLLEKFKFVNDIMHSSVTQKLKLFEYDAKLPAGHKTRINLAENSYKFTPVYKLEKEMSADELETIVAQKMINVLSPEYIKVKSNNIFTKIINRNIIKNHAKKYIHTADELKKEYLINHISRTDLTNEYFRPATDYMVYKESLETQRDSLPELDSKHSSAREKEPDIKIINQPQRASAEVIDTSKIEKNILSKVLTKKDIENLIRSYVEGINVDSISAAVMSRMERKSQIDRQRRGIFSLI